MQFRDLNAQYHALKEQIDKSINEVIESSCFIFGKQVSELEEKLANKVGVDYCVTCGSGTDALKLTLYSWDIGPSDAVFAPDFTFFATIASAMSLSAEPVPVDIDPDTFNMSPKKLEEAIKRVISDGIYTPKAIIPADMFGQCARYDEIKAIADRYGLLVLEDAAQSFGAKINGRPSCSFGDAAATSFYPAKPLGCYGDGGAVFTNDPELDRRLRSVRAQGRAPKDKYDNKEVGFNSRLDTLQAAVLLAKLDRFYNFELDEIDRIAKIYTDELSPLVKTPTVLPGYSSSWAQYTVLLKDEAEREALRSFLKSKDIPTMIYYPRGMHQQTALKGRRYATGDFSATETAVKSCLSLPIHPYLGDDVYTVINAVREFFG